MNNEMLIKEEKTTIKTKYKKVEYIEIEKDQFLKILNSSNGYAISWILILFLCLSFGYIKNNKDFYFIAAFYATISPIAIYIANKLTVNKYLEKLRDEYEQWIKKLLG